MLKTEVAGPAAEVRVSRPWWFVRYAWAVLVFNVVVVVLWGAYVRASGSGAGCGNHWPLCDGEVIPHSPTVTKIIEFTHRATSGIDLALVAALLVWAFRIFPRRHPARLGATLSMVFLLTEALLGASLVLLGHVEKNASVNRAYSLSTHLVNTLTLLACLALTAWWAGGRPGIRWRGRPALLAGISLGAVYLLGISGAIAALGDTLYPSQSLAAGLAQDWDASANIFLRLRALHPLIAAATAGWLLFYCLGAARLRPSSRGLSWIVMAALGAQLLAGTLNLLLLAPIWMQLVHLMLADTLWISLVLLCASMLPREAELKAATVSGFHREP